MHIHPDMASMMARIMDANHLERVSIWEFWSFWGFLSRSKAAFHKGLGERMVYFATPDFRDTSAGFGDRMARRSWSAKWRRALRPQDLQGIRACAIRMPAERSSRDDPRLDRCGPKRGVGRAVLIHTADPVAFFSRWMRKTTLGRAALHPDWYFGTPEFPDHDAPPGAAQSCHRAPPRHDLIGAHLGNFRRACPTSMLPGALSQLLRRYLRAHREIGRHPSKTCRPFSSNIRIVILWDRPGSRLGGLTGPEEVDDLEIKTFYDAHCAFSKPTTRRSRTPVFLFRDVGGECGAPARSGPGEALRA